MNSLKASVGECEGHLQAIESEFEHWLDIAQELSQVATESERTRLDTASENNRLIRGQTIPLPSVMITKITFSHKGSARSLQKTNNTPKMKL